MEPVVGLEPTTDGLQNRCSTTELNWRRYLNHQLELKIPTGVGEVPDSICVPVFCRFRGSQEGRPFTSQAQSILGGAGSMASQFCHAESEFEVNALEIVRFWKCGQMIRRVTCCLQFRELS